MAKKKKYADPSESKYWKVLHAPTPKAGEKVNYRYDQRTYLGLRKQSFNLYHKINAEKKILKNGVDVNGNVLSDENRAKKERYVATLEAKKNRVDKAKTPLMHEVFRSQHYFARQVRSGFEPNSKFNALIHDKSMKSYHKFLSDARKKYQDK